MCVCEEYRQEPALQNSTREHYLPRHALTATRINITITGCQDTQLCIDRCIFYFKIAQFLFLNFSSGLKTLKQHNVHVEARSDKITRKDTNKTDKMYKHQD